jgi:hypothetical protein
MPYKPTGRPNGRPKKTPTEQADVPAAPLRPAVGARARRRFRQIAESLNPSPFITVYDGRGRPRHSPRHSNVKV